MADSSIILSSAAEAELLKPIDEYVGKIQAQIDELRKDGSDKVRSLKNHIAIVKENKNLKRWSLRIKTKYQSLSQMQKVILQNIIKMITIRKLLIAAKLRKKLKMQNTKIYVLPSKQSMSRI